MRETRRRVAPRWTAAALVAAMVVGACGGGDPGGDQRDAATPGTGAPATPGTPGAAPGPATGTAAGAADQIALGRQIFSGQAAGGICYTCHGMDGEGTAIGPNIRDGEWIHGDGSMDFLVRIINQGVPQPKQFPAPMLPQGGSPLNAEQVRAVAAYVYSLSHPQGS